MPQFFLIFPAEHSCPQPVLRSRVSMPDILPVRIMHRCMNRTVRVYFQFHAELAVQQCRPAQKTAFHTNETEGEQLFHAQLPVPENAFHSFFIPAFPGNTAKEHKKNKVKDEEGKSPLHFRPGSNGIMIGPHENGTRIK